MNLKLQGRLSMLVVVSFVPLVFLSVYWTATLRNISYASSQLTEQLITRVFTDRQSELIGSGRSILTMLSLHPVILDVTPENDGAVLEKAMKTLNGLANIVLVDRHGQLISDALGTSGAVNYSDRLWFQETVATKKFSMGEYVIGRITNLPILPIANPVLDADGGILCVIGTSIDLNWMYSLAKELDLPLGTTITLTDYSGALLVRYPEPEKYVGMDISKTEIGKEMIKKTQATITTMGLEGTRRLYVISPLLVNGTLLGSIALGFPLDEVFRKADETLKLNVLLLVAAFLIALIFLLGGLRTLVISPSRELLRAFGTLGSGKSDFRLEVPRRKDEIALLLSAFNGMATELQAYREKLEVLIEERTMDLEKTTVELRRSNDELEQFAYVASHDLQEPLRMVASFTQLLAERYGGKLDAKADQYIHFAVDGSKRMQALINDLLTYSRVGTKGRPFGMTETSGIVAEVLEVLDRPIRENNARIDTGVLPAVVADRSQLAQVFQNLVSNAIKFRGESDPVIGITAEKDGGFWVFAVKDNGIGIERQYFDRIFTVFQRLHEREKYPGNGIGLSIVKKIVERHGGRVWLESDAGMGSRFYFTIPDRKPEGVKK